VAPRLPQARPPLGRQLLRELRRAVGERNVLTTPADLALYAYDSSPECHAPDVVVFPAATEQVAQLVRAANRFDAPYTARGAGTNLSGGSIPIHGGLVIALSRLNHLLGVDEPNRCALVQPGMTNLALQDALAVRGWVFHPDPASQKASTIGGNVAENAGGPHCLKYGVTTNHVLGVRAVLPDGAIADFGGAALDRPGYDMTGLMNGSEGTLGIVTEITVRISRPPETVRTLLADFDSMDAASEAVSAIIAAGIIPAALEMIDEVMVGAIMASMDAGYPLDAEAVLIVELDGLREAAEDEAQRASAICTAHGAREVRSAASVGERERLWAGRKGAFGAAARLAPAYVVNDGVVPRAKLPEVLRQTQEIAARYGLRVGNNFHAGDGNLHPLILLDRNDPELRERARQASMEMLDACVAAGGSISGEHGIGLEKRKALAKFFSPAELAAQAAIKRAFDPRGLCNPGKVLPDELPPVGQPSACISARSAAVKPGADLSVDGKAPVGLLEPGSEDRVAALLAATAQDQVAVIPMGSGTQLDLGMPPERFDYALSLANIAGTIEHDADNLTATIRAGTRLADVQTELAKRGQWLPLDPADESTSVGGIIATDSSGPGRMRYGGCRDRVLGLRVALPSGHVISVGGKTVKNVSGYDLPKLFVGSLGTLGVITAATFKLLPVPERTEWSGWAFDDLAAAARCANQLAASQLELSAIELVSGELAGHPDTWLLFCRAQGMSSAVERQMQGVAQACKEASGQVREDAQPRAPRLRSGRAAMLHTLSVLCRIAVPPANLKDILAQARRLLGSNGSFAASPAMGTAHIAFDADDAAAVISDLRRAAEALGGSLVIERASVEVKLAAGVWGAAPDGVEIMRALKAEFDPRGVLNPGRFVGGI